LNKLGEGTFGVVRKAKRISDGIIVAVKSLEVSVVKKNRLTSAMEFELAICRVLSHPNIALLHAIYFDDKRIYLVMEFCSAGDLWHQLRKGTYFAEAKIASYMWQMVAGIAYCHHLRICHRDIKPENYLLESAKWDAPIKLIDFGLARVFRSGEPMRSVVGTLHYCAPEVLGKRAYDEKCDIWAIGIVAFVLCTRRSPFDRQEEEMIVNDIVVANGDWELLDRRLAGDDHPLKRLIQAMLTREPSQRPQATSFIENEWFREQGTATRRAWCCRRWLLR